MRRGHSVQAWDVVAVAEAAAVDGLTVGDRLAILAAPVARVRAAVQRLFERGVDLARRRDHHLPEGCASRL